MRLADIAPRLRREKVREAVDGILRQADVPLPTGQLVKRVAAFMGIATEEQTQLARLVSDLTKSHPQARPTGETFQKYGRTMQRWEWLPSHRRNTKPSADELEARRRRIAALEADDEWTVHPEPAEDFLEE